MKRIFLTSGLVLCMACPAFADLTAPTTQYPNGTVEGSDPVSTPTCQYPTLEGYNGTSTFTAKWTALYQTITLDKNVGTTAATGGLSTENLTPATLYSVPDDSHVWTGLDGNQNLTGNTGNVGYTTGEAGLLSAYPQYGIFVNYTLNANNGNIGTAVSTGDNRPYLGVYSAGTGGTQYITAGGALTSEGATAAAANLSGTTWYAQYGTVTPTIAGTPTRDGYTFEGWNTDSSATEGLQSLPAISDNNTTLYAIWNAVGYTITYNCGQPSGISTTVAGPSTATQNVTMDGDYTLAGADNCTLDGYTFAGWSCPNLPGTPTLPANAQTQTYFAGGAQGTYSYAGNITCTAQWTPNKINLVWQDNNATTAHVGGDSTCTFDSTIGLPTQVPQRTGYEFGGWQVVNTAASN